LVAALGLALVIPSSLAQPPETDDDLRELIVLLAPESRGAPSPEEVVDAINAGIGPIPGGLAEGNPQRARLAITRRARGRQRLRIAQDEDSDEARLQRYVVLGFGSEADLDGVMRGQARNRHVEFLERNKRVRLHAAAPPTKAALPDDGLLGTPASPPDGGQWGYHLLRFAEAACLGDGGHATVAIIDRGLQTTHEDLMLNGVDAQGSPTLGPGRVHLDRDIAFANCSADELDPEDGYTRMTAGHGSHVTGTIAARTNDGFDTVAGGCRHCSVQALVFEGAGGVNGSTVTVADALVRAKEDGVQVVNMSLGLVDSPCAVGDQRPLCTAIRAAADRDIVLVASSGNARTSIEMPANDSKVIAVGGLEWAGVGADGRPIAAFWDEFPNCPPFANQAECGSNFGPEQDLGAPARDVLSTTYVGFNHNETIECGDSFLPSAPGYGPCRGTSMAAPHVTALVANLRSTDPWLSRDAIYAIVTTTASQADNHSNEVGFGYPDAEAAMRLTLGEAGGQPLPNRLTAFLSFFGVSADPGNPDSVKAETHVYTTVPSIASAFVFEVDDPIDPIGPPVPGHPSFPHAPCTVSPCFDPEPGASISVFTTDKPPFPGAPPLVPLYRLRYDPDIFADCDPGIEPVPHRDFSYTTTIQGVAYFKNNVVDANGVGYDLDGIEGYIFESCEGEPGCTPPPGTVKVYRMFNHERDDYAVFPDSELAAMVAAGYVEQPGLATVIGYAYPNVDSDGDALIDGWEDLIGTNPLGADSDCDGVSDGEEVLGFDLAQNRRGDPLIGPCGEIIFADGFESGDVSLWSSAQP
jgi:subtilisin family serine protease